MDRFIRLAGVVLFAALSVFFLVFGALYASVTDLLWFHAAAVPETARDSIRPLYFALMDLIGAASAGLGLLGFYAAIGPVRRGRPFAAAALAAAFALPLIGAAVVAERLAAATGAPTSWHIMGILLALTGAALACSLKAGRGAAALAENRAIEAKGYPQNDRGG